MAVSPDANVTFWYGCNMTRHGEIVRLVTHILDAVGVAAAPAGGPGYCCGSTQEANARIAAGMAARTVEKFNQAGRDTVVTWCPSCHMNMDDLMAPVTETAFELSTSRNCWRRAQNGCVRCSPTRFRRGFCCTRITASMAACRSTRTCRCCSA